MTEIPRTSALSGLSDRLIETLDPSCHPQQAQEMRDEVAHLLQLAGSLDPVSQRQMARSRYLVLRSPDEDA